MCCVLDAACALTNCGSSCTWQPFKTCKILFAACDRDDMLLRVRDMQDARAGVCCDAAAAQGFVGGADDLNLMLAIECEPAECDAGLVAVAGAQM
jgi:hypothetical protein